MRRQSQIRHEMPGRKTEPDRRDGRSTVSSAPAEVGATAHVVGQTRRSEVTGR
ncbi:hypothetical protein [Natrarchaeobaculum sulfurireducens]|uniref:hypothetical protein n=1 Tax=Natrarchaeobaculum sulfurireducens TaxID=2044521 RepID=UPI0012B5E8F8|nr:hypothetical protein [Natrarchaeobaculum sulfurireducens]